MQIMVDFTSLPPSPSDNSRPNSIALKTVLPQFIANSSSPFGKVMGLSSPVKPDWKNFLLWKFVIILVVEDYNLDGYLFGAQLISKKIYSCDKEMW